MKDNEDHKRRKLIAEQIARLTQHNKKIIETPGSGHCCGCICCGNIFPWEKIKNFEGDTAICPVCGMRTILTDNLGVNIDEENLHQFSRIIQENIVERDSASETLFPIDIVNWIVLKVQRIHRFGRERRGAA
jgi:NAD-dependent SIR2 family protein deacetylase